MKNSPVRVLLIGAAGRMGQTVRDLAESDPEIEIVAQCDLGDAIAPAIKNCDVVIDFSHADAIDEICRARSAPRQTARHRNDGSFSGATHDN